MSIEQKRSEIIEKFGSFPSWEEKYRHIIELGKSLQGLSEEKKTEDNRVLGCQSRVWLVARPTADKKIEFQGDSDALLVKGLIQLLLKVYSDSTPAEVRQTSPDFLKEIGLLSHLSASRANGLQSMLKKIHYYALAFETLFEKK